MNFFTNSIITLAFASTLAANAYAQGRYEVEIVNWSPWTITHVRMSPVGADTWGRDLLGSGVLRADYMVTVQPDRRQGCYYDLKVTFANGDTEEVRDFNICSATAIQVHEDGADVVEA